MRGISGTIAGVLAALVISVTGCQSGAEGGSGAGAAAATSSTRAAVDATSVAPAAPVTTVTTTEPTATIAAPPPTTSAPAGGGSCHARGSGLYVLPDPSCTPGVTNPAVAQADIYETICKRGWTATVRPPESYTEPLKYQQMAAYGEAGSAGNYEEDHLISLELGGSPSSPQNLWPEPGASPNPKDSVENAANHAVCDGQMTLAAAQHDIATDWIALGQQLGVARQETPSTPAGQAASCSASASYSSRYGDWDVYVHSNQPDQTVEVTTSGGATASYHTNSSGYADVYLHAPQGATGQRVTVTVGRATCGTTL